MSWNNFKLENLPMFSIMSRTCGPWIRNALFAKTVDLLLDLSLKMNNYRTMAFRGNINNQLVFSMFHESLIFQLIQFNTCTL